MAQPNPDPHASGYVFVPVNRVTCVFGSSEDAREAVREIAALGFPDDRIEVFVGEQGAETLDFSGERHGVAAKRLRNIEALLAPETGITLQRADAALRAGGVLVAVRLEGDERKNEVAAALRRHRGTVIRYWNRWIIESLDGGG